MGKWGKVAGVMAVFLALAFVAQCLAVPSPGQASGEEKVRALIYKTGAQAAGLASIGLGSQVSVIDDGYDAYTYAELTPSAAKALRDNNLVVEELSGMTTVSLGPVKFDTRAGAPAIPAQYRAPESAAGESALYIVQFSCPPKPSQVSAMLECGANIADVVDPFTYIVEMTPRAQKALSSLAFIGWTGQYHPYYKARGGLLSMQGKCAINAVFFKGAAIEDTLRSVVNAGGENLVVSTYGTWQNIVRMEIDSSNFPALCAIRGLWYAEPYTPVNLFSAAGGTSDSPVLSYGGQDRSVMNDDAAWVIQSGQSGSTPLWTKGITGEGVIVGEADSGIDYDHVAFTDKAGSQGTPGATHRKIVRYWVYAGDDWDDDIGHGTHTACSIAGNRITNPGLHNFGDGMAYNAKIAFLDMGTAYSPSVPSDMNALFGDAAANGANSHSDSWGQNPNDPYDLMAQSADQYCWDNPTFLPMFATGNYGPGFNTVASPAVAKSVLSVGSCGNSGSMDSISSTSSRGPTQEGMTKPDVMAPGENINSAESDATKASYNSGYVPNSGTSTACPIAAGGLALIEQYYSSGFWPGGVANTQYAFMPSGALRKATAMVSGTHITGAPSSLPNNAEGWGRLTLDDALYFSGDARKMWVFDGYNSGGALSTGAKWTQFVNVTAGQSLRIALCWFDYPGGGIKNNLNLLVTSPSSKVYVGNNFAGGETSQGSSATPDGVNPYEAVYINAPEDGMYKMEVTGASVPQGPQKFAVIVTGNVDGIFIPPFTPMTLALQQPYGGENLSAGSNFNIMWKIEGGISPISPWLNWSSDGGATWSIISSTIGLTGTYVWAVPDINTTTARVQLEALDKGMHKLTMASGNFTIWKQVVNPFSVEVLTPNGGELLKGGSSYNITWSSLGGPGLTFELYMSTNSGGSYSKLTPSALNDINWFDWTVPTTDTATARVKVYATNSLSAHTEDASDADFAVDSTLPSLSVTGPSSGAVWHLGANAVSWTAADASGMGNGTLEIQLSKDSGTTWSTVSTGGDPDAGTASVAVTTAMATQTAMLRVWAEDAVGNMGYADSAVFKIDTSAPAITHTPVTSVPTGQLITVSADVTDDTSVSWVKVYYTDVGGSTFSELAMSGSGNTYSANLAAPGAAGKIKYHIAAADSAGTMTLCPATPPSGASDLNYTIDVVDSSTVGSISGYVKDNSGNFAIGATVYAKQSGSTVKQAATDSGGHYSISSLAPGTYDLVANMTGYYDGTLTGVAVTAGSDTSGQDLTITPYGTVPPSKYSVSGTVTDSKTGSALSGATVTISLSGSVKGTKTSGADGSFAFADLDPGTYLLKAVKSGYEQKTRQVVVSASNMTGQDLALVSSSVNPPATSDPPAGLPLAAIGAVVAVIAVVLVLVLVMLMRKKKGAAPPQGPHSPPPYPPAQQPPYPPQQAPYGAPPQGQYQQPPPQYGP